MLFQNTDRHPTFHNLIGKVKDLFLCLLILGPPGGRDELQQLGIYLSALYLDGIYNLLVHFPVQGYCLQTMLKTKAFKGYNVFWWVMQFYKIEWKMIFPASHITLCEIVPRLYIFHHHPLSTLKFSISLLSRLAVGYILGCWRVSKQGRRRLHCSSFLWFNDVFFLLFSFDVWLI